jgi:hypothetical protein
VEEVLRHVAAELDHLADKIAAGEADFRNLNRLERSCTLRCYRHTGSFVTDEACYWSGDKRWNTT